MLDNIARYQGITPTLPTATTPAATTPATVTAPPPAATTTTPPAATTPAASSLEDMLASTLGIPTTQLGTSSGQGRFGDYGATITKDQAEALAKTAGIDLNNTNMQAIKVAGNPTTAGLTIVPETQWAAAGDNDVYLPTGNYVIAYQPNYVGKMTAIAQTKPDMDLGGIALSIFATAMGVPAWITAGANTAYAISQGVDPLKAIENGIVSYGAGQIAGGMTPDTASAVGSTIGNVMGLTTDQASTLTDYLKQGVGATASSAIQDLLPENIIVPPAVDTALTGAIKGATGAALTGGDIGTGAAIGGITEAVKGPINPDITKAVDDIKEAISPTPNSMPPIDQTLTQNYPGIDVGDLINPPPVSLPPVEETLTKNYPGIDINTVLPPPPVIAPPVVEPPAAVEQIGRAHV